MFLRDNEKVISVLTDKKTKKKPNLNCKIDLIGMLININMNVNLIKTGQTTILFAILDFGSFIKSPARVENDTVCSFVLGTCIFLFFRP